MNLIEKVRYHGIVKSIRIGVNIAWRRLLAYHRWRVRRAPIYVGPTLEELIAIERDLRAMDIVVEDFTPSYARFQEFQAENWFHPSYHGGRAGGVWDEKLLEHWISSDLLGLAEYGADDIYVDAAASGSPWVKELRERRNLSAFAIDLAHVGDEYSELPYYRVENATQSSFSDESIRGVSLHCAYEMFAGDDDINLIDELARILKPGGKAVILPLYMHTHYCAYTTPEYFGKGYSDPAAKEYVRMDCYGVPSSRKYNAEVLKQRVLDHILRAGLKYRLRALRNHAELGSNIYCYFILEIEK